MPVYSSQLNFNNDYPTIKPSLNLVCNRSKSLDPRVQFVRSTAATTMGPTGYVEDVGANQPRFDHDPTTGECLGLLVEEGRTNLFKNSDIALGHSSQWQYGSWASGTYTASTATELLPDGSTGNCLKVVRASSGGGSGHFHQGTGPGWTTGKRYCISYWVKGSGAGSFNHSSHSGFSVEVGSSGTTVSTTSEWVRHYIVYATGSIGGGYPYFNLNNMTAGGTIYFWGFQCEELPGGSSTANKNYPTTLIRTGSSHVTRNADQLTIPQKELDTFFNWDEGTFVAEASRGRKGTDANGLLAINDGTSTYQNMIVLYEAYDTQGPVGRVYVGGNGTFGSASTINSGFDNFHTMCFGYKTNDIASNVNGGDLKSTTSAAIPAKSTLTTMKIMRGYGNSVFHGRLKYLRYYPKKLSNATITLLSKN